MEKSEIGIKQANIKRMRHGYGLVIFALITLFNPNINLVDVMPDFIGFLILASLFDKGADAAPYFEEAATGARRLALISILKIPAIFIIAVARGRNPLDNDIIALMAVTFAALEIAFTLPMIKNAFSALFYLGERTDAKSLIRNDCVLCSDNLQSLTYVFFVYKIAISAIPECLRLTRTVDGSYVTGSNIYPYIVLVGAAISLVGGIVWLIRSIKYTKGVYSEGRFYDALETLLTASGVSEHNKKCYQRSVFRAFALITLSTVLTLRLKFDNFHDINLLPPAISIIIIFIAVCRLEKNARVDFNHRIGIRTVAWLAIICSVCSYALNISFTVNHGFETLLYEGSSPAHSAYKLVIISSAAELVLTVLFLLFTAFILNRFILYNIGLSPEDEGYMAADKRYHSSLKRMTGIFTAMGIICAIMRFAEVYINGQVTLILTDGAFNTSPSIVTTSVPWFGAVVTFVTVIYILYTAYYLSTLKDEMRGMSF